MSRKQVNIALTESQARHLDGEAAKHGLTASRFAYGLLAEAIRHICKADGKKPSKASTTAALEATSSNPRRMIPRPEHWRPSHARDKRLAVLPAEPLAVLPAEQDPLEAEAARLKEQGRRPKRRPKRGGKSKPELPVVKAYNQARQKQGGAKCHSKPLIY